MQVKRKVLALYTTFHSVTDLRIRIFVFLSLVFVFPAQFTLAAYKLESGLYNMTIQIKGQKELPTRQVVLQIQGRTVTISHDEQEGVLRGTIKNNRLSIANKDQSRSIKLEGRLTSNNRVEGTARQINKGKGALEGTFTLVKLR